MGRAHLARGARWAPAAVAAWALCATVLPRPLEIPSDGAITLITVAGLIALLAVALVLLPLRRWPLSAQEEEHHAATPRSLEVQPAQRSS
jgi:tellurite resistance protein TehA-like permease